MPDLSKLICDFLAKADGAEDESQFLAGALVDIRTAAAADAAALVAASAGQWSVLAWQGDPMHALPMELLAAAADHELPQSQAAWLAIPLPRIHHRVTTPRILLVQSATKLELDHPHIPELARALAHMLSLVHDRSQAIQTARRLDAFRELDLEEQTNESFCLIASQLVAAQRTVVLRSVADQDRLAPVDSPDTYWDLDGPLQPLARALTTGVGWHGLGDSDSAAQAVRTALAEYLGAAVSSAIAVPIVDRNIDQPPLGMLLSLNKQNDGNFTDRDLEHLQQLADWLAHRWQQAPHDAAQAIHQQLIGNSEAIMKLRARIARVAPTELAVLVIGENGTGKEVVSRMIHRLSQRKDQPFFAINCAALSESLLDSELFGHEKGAFTDADQSKPGKFEAAAGGTLFLDEIGELTPRGQVKLLRAIEEKTIVRVGGSESIQVDARVLAATNRDLTKMVHESTFREDLFFRLNVVTLALPTLRDRREDIEPLANHFLQLFAARAGHAEPRLTAAARQALREHNWPGNVRELRNVMERAAFMSTTGEVDVDELNLSDASGHADTFTNLNEATRAFQITHIQSQVAAAAGNITAAAKRLGLHRSNLYRKMRQLGMRTDDDQP